MGSFVIVIRSAYFGAQKRKKYVKSAKVNRSEFPCIGCTISTVPVQLYLSL